MNRIARVFLSAALLPSALLAFHVNRRAFFGASAAIGTASLANTISKPALAAESLYNPPPSSLSGKTILITGGNTGLGLESAKRLAAAGASIVVTTRTAAKGSQAVSDIQDYLAQQGVKNDKIIAKTLDLCNFTSVQAFAKDLTADRNFKIDVLLNNAGVMAIPDRQVTPDGFERTFQTNHLGHFLLTAKLVPALATDARIINVSSTAYMFAKDGLETDNLNGERQYGPWSSYGLSKLANILFTQELQRRATEAGKAYTVVALHPGAVATDLGRYLVGEEAWNKMKTDGMTLQQKLLFVPLSKFTKTVPQGANTQIYLAADTKAPSPGAYYVDQKIQDVLPYARDPQAAQTLWELSEQMTGTTYSF